MLAVFLECFLIDVFCYQVLPAFTGNLRSTSSWGSSGYSVDIQQGAFSEPGVGKMSHEMTGVAVGKAVRGNGYACVLCVLSAH